MAEFEGRIDMGSEGEGFLIFERSSAQVLLDGLSQMSAQERREWIDERVREALGGHTSAEE